ncbi:MAG: aldehyde dehydrogenase family protein [Acidipropionibacterium acidipropionici]
MTTSTASPITDAPVAGPDDRQLGAFDEVADAVQAAQTAFATYLDCTLAQRRAFIAAIREESTREENLRHMAYEAVAETKMGNAEHKVLKNKYAATLTPGVEDLLMEAYQSDTGMTTMEYAPYGVIGAITPTTNPTETIISNGISMLAAGNAVVFSPHPRARRLSVWLVDRLNRALIAAGAPENLMTIIRKPSMDATAQLMASPQVQMLVATGGPQIVNMVLSSGKKAIGAGSGNPPVVVDETADIPKAARDIVNGASFDNNLPCTAEKEVVAVSPVVPELVERMVHEGAQLVNDPEILERLRELLMSPDREHPRPSWVGQDAGTILQAVGVTPDPGTRLIITETSADDPLVQVEMLMPVLPIVATTDASQAIDLAIDLEHGHHHTAIMHSRDVSRLESMARRSRTTIFVKNGPSYSGIGIEGEGFATFTIAGPTGEGLTSARSFARRRRCVLNASM